MTYTERLMRDCTLCPRRCHVNRLQGQRGACGMTAELRIARAALHPWEEPCISGEQGSGTVFFSGCPLQCVYCQNHEIAAGRLGKPCTTEQLAETFLDLQAQHAHNINLVTPTHMMPRILDALQLAKEKGLRIPIVYNTGGYENPETLKLLEGWVDIYLTDFKYMSAALSGAYSHAADYAEMAKPALAEMVRQTGEARFSPDGMMRRGVIVRHLLLPGQTADSKTVVEYLYRTYGDKIWISLMNQYTPLEWVQEDPVLHRRVTQAEYDAVVDYAVELGVENGFTQEGEAASESFIPQFEGE
ncbi:MAG: radical SAM protein [Oscillibacter sp.]|uniref:radical SAM protein n=1 Tax=Ruminococcus sp. TaxID=41978 RepID=UPI0026077701|nr:radical SAM protein [Ruminococcus sp.]MDD7509744.1 radical SAM protein [Oscillibacter sp.]MDD7556566.1 radical SAM protein [Ruminococcus sp.]MDY4963774.1 radical SAM protein [Ruminococcus callidus]MDY5710728.1 radical SAM protein [Oscillospiraceae bacterium]